MNTLALVPVEKISRGPVNPPWTSSVPFSVIWIGAEFAKIELPLPPSVIAANPVVSPMGVTVADYRGLQEPVPDQPGN